jgi:hypothetical protein
MQPLQIQRYVAAPLLKSKTYQGMGVEFKNEEENQKVYTADEEPVRTKL